MSKKFRLLVANGDSFSAGDETALPEFFPEFGQLYTTNTVPPRDKSFKRWNKYLKTYPNANWHGYKDACLNYSFPMQLGELLNLETINLSMSGQSNSTTAATTIGYLEEKIKPNYYLDEVLVVINLTSFGRLKIPKIHNQENYWSSIGEKLYNCGSLIMGYTDNWPAGAHDLFSIATDRFLVIDNLVAVLAMVKYFEMHNISYIFTDSGMYQSNRFSLTQTTFESSFLNAFPDVSDEFQLRSLVAFDSQVTHFGGHYSKEIHTQFALRLYTHIISEFKDRF